MPALRGAALHALVILMVMPRDAIICRGAIYRALIVQIGRDESRPYDNEKLAVNNEYRTTNKQYDF